MMVMYLCVRARCWSYICMLGDSMLVMYLCVRGIDVGLVFVC
jgi:hypothetical protein